MNTLILGEIDISSLVQAHTRMQEALAQPARNDLEQAGAIQYFEFCYELAWKTMKRVLNMQGQELNSPRTVFRAAAKEKLIDNPEQWFAFIELRNLTTNTYYLLIAREVYSKLPKFNAALTDLITKLQALS